MRVGTRFLYLVLTVLTISCRFSGKNSERALRAALTRGDHLIQLPAGTLDIHSPLVIPAGTRDIAVEGDPSGTTLRLATDFRGAAVISGTDLVHVRLSGFRIVGNRRTLGSARYLPPSDVAFADFYDGNGLLFRNSRRVEMRNLSFEGIIGFPVLISHCSGVTIEGVTITNSGSLNAQGHSNTTGGILLEEGSSDFSVSSCNITHIRGNGIWTHSKDGSAQNRNGIISHNRIQGTPRDAIQIGHALNIQVIDNQGSDIGVPVAEVDVPGRGTPVALDSAGDVSNSVYSGNHFRDVDGQCIDLDGFHDGKVVGNSCVNRLPADHYPLSHEAIVFGNSNEQMLSENVVVRNNSMEGFGYGGVFLIGRRHEITNNRFVDLNRNHCTGDMSVPRCNYAPEEPGMLRSGIYLADHAARASDTRDNVIRNNEISGFGMDRWCVELSPRLDRKANRTSSNVCTATR